MVMAAECPKEKLSIMARDVLKIENVNKNCQYKGQLTSQKKWTTNIVQEKQDNHCLPLQPQNESWRALISKLRPVAK